MTDKLTELAEFIVGARLSDVPEAAIHRARQVTADTVAAIVGGSAEPEIRALTARLAPTSNGTASVLGTAHCAAPQLAGMLNGTAGTFLEMDEGNQYSRGHPAIHAFPAALARAETTNAKGEAFLLAMVLGYEVGARIGIGARIRMSMHPHGTWGTTGAAVAVAKLAGANVKQMREVINVSSSLGLGTSRQTMLQGGTVRNSFAGFSAQLGAMAWDMVEAGFTGERDGLATVWGTVLSEEWDPTALTDELGQRYEIARNYFKRHACCRYNHGALDALAMLRAEHAFTSADIEHVRVETYSLAAQLCDREPRNTLAGKFSVPFAIASTLIHDSSGLGSFTLDAIGRDDVRALATRVEVVEDPSLTALMPDFRPARVHVTLTDGRSFESYTKTNRGDTEDPYEQDVLTEKYYELTTRVWSLRRAEAVFNAANRVDELPNIRRLLEGHEVVAR